MCSWGGWIFTVQTTEEQLFESIAHCSTCNLSVMLHTNILCSGATSDLWLTEFRLFAPRAVWWQHRVNKTCSDFSLWTQLSESRSNFHSPTHQFLIISTFQFKGAVIFYHDHLADVFPEKPAGCHMSRGVELHGDPAGTCNKMSKLQT